MNTIKYSVATVLLGTGGIAFAQADPEPMSEPELADPEVEVDVETREPTPAPMTTAPAQPAPYYTEVEPTERTGMFGDMSIDVAAGGGVSGFTNDDLRDVATPGGAWQVRLTFDTGSPLALEAAYIGSAQDIDALGLDTGAVLMSHGAQGALKLSAPIESPVQPFVFGGAAWRRYNIANEDFNNSDIRDSDNVVEFPFGVGIGGEITDDLTLDVRGELRISADEELMPDLVGDDFEIDDDDPFAPMHRWGVVATLGYAF